MYVQVCRQWSGGALHYMLPGALKTIGKKVANCCKICIMPLVVGITFRKVGKVYYFDPGEIELSEGDFVIAETARGTEFGEVVIAPKEVTEEELVAPLKQIVRVATGDDLQREADNREREKEAFQVCEEKIAKHRLPMKLLDAEFAFDGSQITFSFSAEGRVDFRELVKDIAGALKTRVQLHQIGVRDEAKLIGGYGSCGRTLCCATFINNFEPISMKMAKDQSLFLNPAKFSGVCGKLMCCLSYEHDIYKQAQKMFPNAGAIIELEEHGRVRVMDVNIISGMITCQTEEESIIHIHISKLDIAGKCRKHGVGCQMKENGCFALRDYDENRISSTVAESDDEEDDDHTDDDVPDEDLEPEHLAKIEEKEEFKPAGGVVFRSPGASADKKQEPERRDRGDGGGGRRSGGNRRRSSNERGGQDNNNRPQGRDNQNNTNSDGNEPREGGGKNRSQRRRPRGPRRDKPENR